MAVYRTVTANATLSDNTVQAEGTVSDEIARVTAVSQSVRTVASSDYAFLTNKPSINGIELVGDKTSAELGIISDAERTAWNASLNAAVNSDECLTFWHASDVI